MEERSGLSGWVLIGWRGTCGGDVEGCIGCERVSQRIFELKDAWDKGVETDTSFRPSTVLGLYSYTYSPTHITSFATLHHTHLGPHDTFTAIANSPTTSQPPHGPEFPQPDLPTGSSSPTGTLLFSFASPKTPIPLGTTINFILLNAAIEVTRGPGGWTIKVLTTSEEVKSFAGKAAEDSGETFEVVGVEVEVQQFAEAVLGSGEGKPNLGEPREALYDLSVIEAALNSEGKSVELASLGN